MPKGKDECIKEHRALRKNVKNLLLVQAQAQLMLPEHVKADADWKGPPVSFELDKAHCDCTGSAPVEHGPAKDLG